jgi:hypothetical protein
VGGHSTTARTATNPDTKHTNTHIASHECTPACMHWGMNALQVSDTSDDAAAPGYQLGNKLLSPCTMIGRAPKQTPPRIPHTPQVADTTNGPPRQGMHAVETAHANVCMCAPCVCLCKDNQAQYSLSSSANLLFGWAAAAVVLPACSQPGAEPCCAQCAVAKVLLTSPRVSAAMRHTVATPGHVACGASTIHRTALRSTAQHSACASLQAVAEPHATIAVWRAAGTANPDGCNDPHRLGYN